MRILLIILFFLINTYTISYSQKQESFEGIITFKKETMSDTLFYNYYIKGSKVRVDYILRTGQLVKYKIIDFGKGEYKVINPGKKLYVQTYITPLKIVKDNNLEIQKTQNYKYIEKRKCYQWIVKDKTNNTVVSYWVANDEYNYYPEILAVLDETEKISSYFIQIPNNEGFMPLLSVERSWLRDKRMKMSAQKIIRMSVDDNLFEVPKGYLLFN